MSSINIPAPELAAITQAPVEIQRIRYAAEGKLGESARCRQYASQSKRWAQAAIDTKEAGGPLRPKQKREIRNIQRYLDDTHDWNRRADELGHEGHALIAQAADLETQWRNQRGEKIEALTR